MTCCQCFPLHLNVTTGKDILIARFYLDVTASRHILPLHLKCAQTLMLQSDQLLLLLTHANANFMCYIKSRLFWQLVVMTVHGIIYYCNEM